VTLSTIEEWQEAADESLAVKNALASALATHMQMGLELGLWLAQTKRVNL
jgi:hypothetical protein